MSYDAQKDLVPLGVSSGTPSVLVVRSDAPYRSFAELIAAKLALLGILQTYATPEQQAAEIREEFRRVGEMVKKAGLTK